MDVRTQSLIHLISRSTGTNGFSIDAIQACGGGCIHRAELVRLSDGRVFFVKSNRRSADVFAKEAEGLAAIEAAGAIAVPRIIALGGLPDEASCLVLEAISSSQPQPGFWAQFGNQFARLHQMTRAACFGWSSDNYLGSSQQKNDGKDDWVDFFAECRLAFQLRLARNGGRGSMELFRLGQRLMDRLDKLIGNPRQTPSLLHGDLWSGNYLVGHEGQPVLIDPAVSYGSREADLAMPLLFGGFPREFFDAYQETWPLDDGWLDRVELYKLYHLLNHLNLFGSGYLDSCLEILRRFAR